MVQKKNKDRRDYVLWDFKAKITLASFSFVLFIILVVWFVLVPAAREELIFSAAILAGLATFASMFYAIRAADIKYDQTVVQNSFDLIRTLNSRDVVELRHKLLIKFDHNKITKKEFYSKITSDEEIHTAVKFLLNLLDDVSIAVQVGHADEKIIHKALAFVLPWTFQTFTPYIEDLRVKQNDKRLLCEVEKLSDAWKQNKYLTIDREIPSCEKS